MSILYDPAPRALINPSDHIKPISGFPKLCVSTFSRKIIETFAEEQNAPVIAEYHYANGIIPIYDITFRGIRAAVCMLPVGAPCSAGLLEEMICYGTEYFVCFGSCGILDQTIPKGSVILPTHACRDEGVSYHYLPDDEFIALSRKGIRAMKQTFEGLEVPYTMGKTWTTDGFYRETISKLTLRRSQGCVAVDMECAALAAVAQFRGISFAQFLYSTDTLTDESWTNHSLNLFQGMDARDLYLEAAFRCGQLLEHSSSERREYL